MAIARTGVYVDDYLECKIQSLFFSDSFRFRASFFFFHVDASTFPAELQRLLNTVRELDERSQCKDR